ncbi:MAG: methionine aminotransferase [Chitinophagaceae bacterium]
MKSKLPNIATNIFTVMSAMANEYKAINLSQGFPDFPISDVLIEHVYKAMKDGHNQYAPMIGMPALRTALSEKIKKCYNKDCDANDEITIVPGATYAIYAALTAILEAGDEVIVLEPAYDSYIPNIEMNGAKAVCVPLRFPDFSVDWQLVKEHITAKTKAIIINSPHNPSGYVWTHQDMLQLIELVQNTAMYIISDEVYEHIIFDDKKHMSIIMYPELYERSFVLFSFGKVFHTTGWKMGYCVAPKKLSAEFRKMHQFISFTTNTPMQIALSYYLKNESAYTSISKLFQQKRDLFINSINHLPFTIYNKAHGTYFQTLGYEQISKSSDTEFSNWLTQKIGVACIPISAFYQNKKDDKMVRFCFGKKEETLQMAIEKLNKLLK